MPKCEVKKTTRVEVECGPYKVRPADDGSMTIAMSEIEIDEESYVICPSDPDSFFEAIKAYIEAARTAEPKPVKRRMRRVDPPPPLPESVGGATPPLANGQ